MSSFELVNKSSLILAFPVNQHYNGVTCNRGPLGSDSFTQAMISSLIASCGSVHRIQETIMPRVETCMK
jgi:hypothetical protein